MSLDMEKNQFQHYLNVLISAQNALDMNSRMDF